MFLPMAVISSPRDRRQESKLPRLAARDEVALLGKEVPFARSPVDAPKVKSNDSFSLKDIVTVYSWAAATAPLSVCFVILEHTEF